MILFDGPLPAPHPRRVRIFLAEKEIRISSRQVSMIAGEHKAADILALNSLGQLPILQLDDGTILSESVAICRYLESQHPEPPLFGTSALEIAQIDMWIRRIDFQIAPPLSAVWLHSHPMTEAYMQREGLTRFAAHGDENRIRYAEKLAWLDAELDGRAFIAGSVYSMADIVALSMIDFGRFVGLQIPAALHNLGSWHARMSDRPSSRE